MANCLKLLAFVVFVGLCSAATTGRQPSKVIGATAEKGKDSRPLPAAFANAGTKPGTEVWRIVKFNLETVPPNEHGKFFSGDSYIILSTKESSGKKIWTIYFWLGKETSVDESGSAAIYTVQLDDKFSGQARQVREEEGNESADFKKLFNNNIQYKSGGASSGLRHVQTKIEPKMYLVKGKKNVRVRTVEPSVASLNQGDCFIYDNGNEIFAYHGAKSSRVEKLKATSAAGIVRDVDRNGRAKVTVIDGFDNIEEIKRFYTQLGIDVSKQMPRIPDDNIGMDDAAFEKQMESQIVLQKVTEAGKLEKITQRPITQKMLDENDCFILESGESDIYVWQGKKATQKEKTVSIQKAEEIKKTKKYPAWTKVVKIIQNAEPSIFRQIFQTWQGVGESHPRLIRDLSRFRKCEPSNPKMYHLKTISSKSYVKYIDEFDQSSMEPNDVMIVDDGCKIYVWFGKDSSQYERMQGLRPSKFLPRFMQNKKPQYLETLYFKQNNEPWEFIKLFPTWTPDLWDNEEFEENEIPEDKY